MSKPAAVTREVEGIERLVQRMRGRKLPPERELSKQFGISRGRVRAVLDGLEARGLVVRHQGSGTYALEDGSTAISTVALLVDAQLKLANDPFASAVIERVQQVCQSEGLRCTLERVSDDDRPAIVEDGIVAVGLATRSVLERLTRKDVPAVGLFVRVRPSVSRVTILDLDDEAGGAIAIEHLLAARCEPLVFLGSNDVPASARRAKGAAEAAALSGRSLKVVQSELTYAAGLVDAARLAIPPADGGRVGVIAGSDWLALGLHTGLMNRGKNARDRVEIVSFDGLPITADASLKIRSLAAPIDTMAADAVAELRRLASTTVSCGREILYAVR